MSVQLIIAPQSTPDVTSTTTTTLGTTNYVVDGLNFNSIPSSNLEQNSPAFSFLPSNLMTPNTWFRYINPATYTQPTAPAQIGNKLYIYNADYTTGSQPYGGVYQRIIGLTNQTVYRLTINFTPNASSHFGRLYIKVMKKVGVNLWFEAAPTAEAFYNTTVKEIEWNSNYGDEFIIHLHYVDTFDPHINPAVPIVIDNISVNEVITTTTEGFSPYELLSQEILDLYEDETIPLTLSVDDFKDVATKTQSYSKAFHLPATKKNNRIFGNLFEVTKASGAYTFNPYKKTSVMLKENGFIVFEGFLKLIDIVDKKGEISYNVNLYSDSVALMDAMKDLTFADLNLSELDHTYNLTSIEASQTGALPLLNPLQADSFAGAAGDTTTSVLKYPFLNWAGSIRRNATSAQVSDGATSGRPSLKRLEDGFRPFINVKYLVDNIFKDAGFTYSSAFFDSSYFSNLFMDFNWGEEPNGSAPLRNDFTRRKSDTSASLTYIAQSPSWTNVPVSLPLTTGAGGGSTALWNNSWYGLQSDVNNLAVTGSYKIELKNKGGTNVDTWTSTVRVCKFNSNNSVLEVFEEQSLSIDPGDTADMTGTYETVLNNGDYIQMEARTYNSDGDMYISDNGYSYLTCYYNNNAVQVPTLLDAARGEMVQWDFLKGLFTMFNLITLQDKQNPSNILIEPYNDVFSDDVTTLDWTHKVDVSDIKLKALDLKKRVVFKYEEDEDDYPFGVYKLATGGYLYGSLILDSSQLDLLSGEDEVIASPFAATIMKDLFDDTPELTIPSIYGSNEEVTEFGSIKNLPRILIDTGVNTASDTFYVPAQNGGSDSNKSTYSLFSHTSAVPATSTDDDLNFGACQLIGTSMGVSPLNNLYSTYYARYFQELYSPDVKSMTLKVLLTPNDIANFNFYDKVFIKNREYRVDKINYKPNDLSTVDFILIT